MYQDELTLIINRVSKHMSWSPEKVELWLKTPNPFLGNVSPINMVYIGRGYKVLKFIEDAIENQGQYP